MTINIHAIRPSEVLTLDASQGSSFRVVLSIDVSEIIIANPTDAQHITIIWVQDDNGGWTVVLPDNADTFVAPATDPFATTIQEYVYNAFSNLFCSTSSAGGGGTPGGSSGAMQFNVSGAFGTNAWVLNAVGDGNDIIGGQSDTIGIEMQGATLPGRFAGVFPGEVLVEGDSGTIDISGNTSGLQVNNVPLHFVGTASLLDSTSAAGTSGQLLSSTSTGVLWVSSSASLGPFIYTQDGNTPNNDCFGTNGNASGGDDNMRLQVFNVAASDTLICGMVAGVSLVQATNIVPIGALNLTGTTQVLDNSGQPGVPGKYLQSLGAGSGNQWTVPTYTVLQTTFTIQAAGIKQLHGVPFQVMASPGAGQMILILSAVYELVFGTTPYTVASGATIDLTYNGTLSQLAAQSQPQLAFLDQFASSIAVPGALRQAFGVLGENATICVSNSNPTDATVGDSVVVITLSYMIVFIN